MESVCLDMLRSDDCAILAVQQAKLRQLAQEPRLGDQMNPKRVYGSYTLIGIIVPQTLDPLSPKKSISPDVPVFWRSSGSRLQLLCI